MLILNLLGYVIGLGYLICFILVLVKQFQSDGPVQGIIGIVTCGIWTFIWGWLKADRENIKGVMMIWSLLAFVWFLFKVLGGLGRF